MLLGLVHSVDSLGFGFFISIWMILLGLITVGGFFTRFNHGKVSSAVLVQELAVSWFVGIVLFFSTSPNIALFIAIILRAFIEAVYALIITPFNRKKKPLSPFIAFAIVGILIVLFLSSFWNPPVLLSLLSMDEVELLEPMPLDPDTSIRDITYDDLSDIRIVSQEYASQLPRTELVETGYDVAGSYSSVDVYPYDNGLRWLAVYEPTILFKKGIPSPYYVQINAMNPADREKVKKEITYSERDPFWSTIISQKILNTKFLLKLQHPAYKFGDGYYVPELDSWIYPYGYTDYNILPLAVIYKQLGVAVIDSTGTTTAYEFGAIPEQYQELLLLEEYYAEEQAYYWAKYHKWDGVITYHFSQPEIFEPAEDLFFQYDLEDNHFYGLLQFEPAGSQRKSIVAWAEMEANGPDTGSLAMYDARDLGLIGPIKAISIIESEVSQYSKEGFEWVVFQPQFKQIKGRYVYVAPIYAGYGVRITIKGIGIVDAKSEQVKILLWKDVVEGEFEAPLIEILGEPALTLPESCEIIYSTDTQDFYACEK
ncbi:hypothetical protein ACFLQI_02330 [Candidatus Undinarchaeota archaeon]